MSRRSSNIDVWARLRNGRRFQREVNDSGDALEAMGVRGARSLARFAAQGERLKDFGRSWSRRVTLPLLAGAVAATGFAINWESDFAGVRKTVSGTEAQMVSLDKGIRGMSMRIPVSASELAEIAEAAGQLGVQRQNILGFTRTVADLGVASNLAGEEGATTLARFANITQMPQSQFDRLGSTIVALGNAGASTEADIGAMGLRIASAGAMVGMSEASILGYANALSSLGIEAEAGGTSISTVFKEINTAVAGGGKDLESFASVAGMSAGAFRKAWEQDAAGASVSFIEGLARLKKEGEDIPSVLAELSPRFKASRVQDTLLRAAGGGDLLRESLQLGAKAWHENNALTQEATKRYATLKSRLQILKNIGINLAVVIGSELVPALADLAEFLGPKIQSAAEAFSILPDSTKAMAAGAVVLLAAIGPLAYIMGFFATQVGRVLLVTRLLIASWKGGALMALRFNLALLRMRATLIAQAVATRALVGAQLLLNAALLANPIGLIAAAVLALTAGFVILYLKVEAFRNFVDRFWPALVPIIGLMVGPILAVVFAFVMLRKNGTAAFNWVKNAAVDFVNFVGSMPGRIASAASGLFNGVKEAFRAAVNWIIDKWNSLELRIGGMKIDPPGPGSISIPSVSLQTPDIPHLARGGTAISPGAALVGDDGPEIVELPRAARVRPLRADGVDLSSVVGGVKTVILRNVIDGKVVGESIVDLSADAEALA